MKKQIIIISVLFLIFNYAKAQQNNNNDPLNNLDMHLMEKLNGTWEGKSGKEIVKLVLKREHQPLADDRMYFVYGWCNITRNGKTIINDLDNFDNLKYATLNGYIKKGDPTLHFIFTDNTRDKLRNGVLTFTNNNENDILLTVYPKDRTRGMHEKLKITATDTIPRAINMKLHRVN